MTCQHCQTWILDDDHRCRRCGSRVRATPARISPASYPIAATATAPAYDLEPEPTEPAVRATVDQQPLFAAPFAEGRVIPFDSLTSSAERQAIRQRVSETERPAPVKSAKVESRRSRTKRHDVTDQSHLEFHNPEQPMTHAPGSVPIRDAPVATTGVRVQAALWDALLIGCAVAPGAALFLYVAGRVNLDKHTLPFFAAALLTVPLLY